MNWSLINVTRPSYAATKKTHKAWVLIFSDCGLFPIFNREVFSLKSDCIEPQ